jgi:hypothetical protein
MPTREYELVRDALDDTNQEIFDEAFGGEGAESIQDRSGDRSLEQMDAIDGSGAIGDFESEADARGERVVEPDEDELEAAERDAEMERLKQRNAELENIYNQELQAARGAQETNDVNAILQDPSKAAAVMRSLIHQNAGQRFRMSVDQARAEDPEGFGRAWEAISDLPQTAENRALAERIFFSNNPGEEIRREYERRAGFGGGGGGGGGRSRLPGSLNTGAAAPYRSSSRPAFTGQRSPEAMGGWDDGVGGSSWTSEDSQIFYDTFRR